MLLVEKIMYATYEMAELLLYAQILLNNAFKKKLPQLENCTNAWEN